MEEIERETVLNAMKNDEIKVICNCMVLTEGWDLPKISACIIARPTKSYGLYLQMVGRSLRICPPEKNNTIVIDHSGCIYEHGFIEDVPEWELTISKDKKNKRKEKKLLNPLNKQLFTCVRCDTVYKINQRKSRMS